MLKKSYLLSISLILLLVLAACGSTTEPNDQKTAPNEENESTVNDELENAKEDEEVVEGEGEQEEEQTEETENDQNAENETIENEEEQTSTDLLATAEQVDSDAQDFSIYVLPDYTLTSEEPGRDSLYLTEDGQFFMRIETLPADDETYDYLKENTVTSLEATGKDGSAPTELTDDKHLPQGEAIEDMIGYTIDTEDGTTSGIVFKRGDLLIRLMIFDTPEKDYFTDFLQMGETITKK